MANDILLDSAIEFQTIKDYNYRFTIAKSGKSLDISLRFLKQDYTHIVGLDHLSDRFISKKAKYKSGVFDDIVSGQITLGSISSSKFFNAPFPSTYNIRTKAAYTLSERIEASKDIIYYLDNVDKWELYKWDKYKSYIKMPDGKIKQSLINADYMLAVPSKTNPQEKMYIFMYEKGYKNQTMQLCVHSAFPDCLDLSQGQERAYAILCAEKVNIKTKQTTVLRQRRSSGNPNAGNPNIMKMTFNTPGNNLLDLNSNGAAVLTAPRRTFGQVLTNLINRWAEKIGEGIERRRQELKSAKEEIVELKQAISERDEQLAQKEEQLNAKDNEIAGLKKQNVALMVDLNEKNKLIRAANPPKTLSQKIEDATKRSREKKAAAPPRPKPTDHKPKR